MIYWHVGVLFPRHILSLLLEGDAQTRLVTIVVFSCCCCPSAPSAIYTTGMSVCLLSHLLLVGCGIWIFMLRFLSSQRKHAQDSINTASLSLWFLRMDAFLSENYCTVVVLFVVRLSLTVLVWADSGSVDSQGAGWWYVCIPEQVDSCSNWSSLFWYLARLCFLQDAWSQVMSVSNHEQ